MLSVLKGSLRVPLPSLLTRTMSATAQIIDGTRIAKYYRFNLTPRFSHLNFHLRSLRDDVAENIKSWKSKYPRFQPQLAIVQAGSRADSTVYIRMKAKAADEVGITLNHITLPESATVEEVVSVVKNLNDDISVSGVLVQLPLGPHIGAEGERTVTEAISPEKDVDGSVFTLGCHRSFHLTGVSLKFSRLQHRSSLLTRFRPFVRPMHPSRCHVLARVCRGSHRRSACGRSWKERHRWQSRSGNAQEQGRHCDPVPQQDQESS